MSLRERRSDTILKSDFNNNRAKARERRAGMVCITKCSYCVETTHDGRDHDECRADFFEDLLAQVQASLKEGKGQDLPVRLKRQLLKKKFRGIATVKRARSVGAAFSESVRV